MKIYYYNGTLWKDVTALDSSFCEETIDRFNRISLDFVLPSEELVPELCHVTWRGDKYTLYTVPKVVKVSTREYRYTLILEGRYKELERTLVKDKLGRTKFVFTGRADQYADLISGCIDGWSTGTYTTGDRTQVVAFSNNTLLEACQMVASKFETEVQLDGGKIAFGRVEKYKGDPLTLAYRQGLQKEITTEPDSKETALGRLYVMGGEHNIDPAKYGSRTLHLPKGGSLSVEGHTFLVDAEGRYISLEGDTRLNTSERAFDATTIYPKRVGTISKVEQVGDEWDVLDDANTIDYGQHRVGGDVMRLEFQSGRLAGRSFDLTTKDDKLTGYVHAEKRFRLVRREIDGVLMPEPATFFPTAGDKYAIFGCSLPDEYIKSAEAEMLSTAVKYMAERLEARVQYRAELDGLWAKKNWSTVAHKLTIGTIVRLEGATNDVRISSVRTSLNSPYTPRITFSNAPYMVGSLTTQIATIESAEVRTREETRQSLLSLQARTYEDTKVVREMIERLRVEGFTHSIKPETLQSMYAVIGSPALQFDFVRGGGSVPFSWSEGKGGTITIPGQSIRRKTSGTTLEPGDKSTVTDIPALTYTLKAEEQQAYVYTELSPAPHFVISTKPLAISPDRLLVGLLNGEEGKRAFTPLYGFTEITPGQLKTDLIRSQDGKSYWDLLSGKFATIGDLLIGDPKGNTCLAYIDGVLYVKGLTVNVGSSTTTIEDALLEQERKLKEEADARAKAEAELERKRTELEEALEGLRKSTGDEQAAMAEVLGKVNKTLTSLQEQVDKEVSNWFYPGAPAPDKEPENAWITNQDKYRHIGDTYTSVDESGEYMGKSWRYTTEYKWQEIHDTLISKALSVAAKAQTTADGKSTTYYTQPSRYSVGDSWVLSADTTVGGKVYKKGTMLFASATSEVFVGSHWGERLKYIDSAKLDADLRASEKKSKDAWEAYATAKAGKAGEDALKAAKEYAEAQDAAYEARTKAYADKILTEKEQALIAAADAKAALAEKRAKAYADGKVTEAEQLAIDKAQKAYDDAVKRAKELDGEIQVGGRNLLLDTSKERRQKGGYSIYKLATPIPEPGKYILSFDVEVIKPPKGGGYCVIFGYQTTLYKYTYANYVEGATHYEVPIDVKRITREGWASEAKDIYIYPNNSYVSHTAPDSGETIFSHVKLERGTVATDWTPAPEDIQAEIDEINANPPRISAGGTWEVYVPKRGKYIDTGRNSKGDNGRAPIVKDGNWWEYDPAKGDYTDTGIKAIGKDGKDGKDGENAQNVRPNILRVRDIINPFNLPYDEKKKAFIIYPHDKAWRVLKASNDDIVAGKSLVYSYTLRNKSDVGYDVTHTYNRRADGKILNDLIKPGETVRIYMHRTDDYSSFILNKNNAFSPTKGYIEVSDFKVEEVGEGELPIPTAYIPHPDDLIGGQGPRGLQGLQGVQGKQGLPGKDGLTAYTHIAYADTAQGGGFSQSPAGKSYVGMYVDHTATDSTSPSAYKWSLIKGADGRDGIPGKPGKDGRTPYLHIAYANSSDGKQGFSVTESSERAYIGQYTDYSQPDSSEPSRYTWSRIKGDKGDKGDGLEVDQSHYSEDLPPIWYQDHHRMSTVREIKSVDAIRATKWAFQQDCLLETITDDHTVTQHAILGDAEGVTLYRRDEPGSNFARWLDWACPAEEVKELEKGLSSANTLIQSLEQAQEMLNTGKLNKADLPNIQYLLDSLQDGNTSHKGGLLLTNDIILSDPKSKDVKASMSGTRTRGAKAIRLGIKYSGEHVDYLYKVPSVNAEYNKLLNLEDDNARENRINELGYSVAEYNSRLRYWRIYPSAEKKDVGETTAFFNNGIAHIGGLFFNGEYISFGTEKDSYMQIGGSAKSESEMVSASTEIRKFGIASRTMTKSSIVTLDMFDSRYSNREIKYTAKLSAFASARAYEVPINGDWDPTHHRYNPPLYRMYALVESYATAQLRLELKRGGSVIKTVTSPEVSVKAVASGGQFANNEQVPQNKIYVSDLKDRAVTLTISPTDVRMYDTVTLSLITKTKKNCHRLSPSEVNSYAEASASAEDIVNFLPYDTSTPMVSVTKDKAAFFYGRSKYVLLNYIRDAVLKVVGNMIIQGNLILKGDLTAEYADFPGVPMIGGMVSEDCIFKKSFGRYKNRDGRNVPQVSYDYSSKIYTVYHSIGNDKYIPVVTPMDHRWGDTLSISNVLSYSFQVQLTNGSQDRNKCAFTYVCFKAD